jgi:8-oxo-dGTP diphosphatase
MPTVTKKQKLTFGGVVFDNEGRVLLVQPKGQFDGYIWTFPKSRADDGENPDDAAMRHVRLDVGLQTRMVACIPGTFRGGTSQSIYYLLMPSQTPPEESHEAATIRWATPDEARQLIAETTNAIGKKRDLNVLAAALASRASLSRDWYGQNEYFSSPRGYEAFARRLLQMVAVLHQRGFESLRIMPGMSASGCHWRTALAPASLFEPRNGAMLPSDAYHRFPRYTTGEGMGAFGWMDAAALTLDDLADRFESEHAAMLQECRPPDPEYVQWYQEMLDATQPLGLVIAYWDMRDDDGYLATVGHCLCQRLLPPPVPNVTDQPRNTDS